MAVQLSQEALEARRKYQREYYARNREKLQRQHAAYWERQAEREAEQAQRRQKTAENGRKQGTR